MLENMKGGTPWCVVVVNCLSQGQNSQFILTSLLSVIFRIKIIVIELNTGKILEGNLVQSAFRQTLRDKSTFQQDNNLKHKAKYFLELLTKKTLNVPEWPSYSWLKSTWKSMARLGNGCLVIINQFDRAWRIKKIIMCKYCTIQMCKALRDFPQKTQMYNLPNVVLTCIDSAVLIVM